MNLTNRPVTPKGLKRKKEKPNDKVYLEWLSYQPSCIDGAYGQYVDGVGRNIACHVRRVNRGSGIGVKPQFSAVPMTLRQHDWQHNFGEDALLGHFFGKCFTESEAAEWFELQADKYLDLWKKSIELKD